MQRRASDSMYINPSNAAHARRSGKRWLEGLARFANWIVMFLAAVGVLGWIIDRTDFLVPYPGLPTIRPLSVLVMIVTACALTFLGRIDQPKARQQVAICTLLLGILATASLVLDIGNGDALDFLTLYSLGLSSQRMPLGNAILYMMLAIAFAGINNNNGWRLHMAHGLVIAIGSIAFIVMVHQTLLLVRLDILASSTAINLWVAIFLFATSISMLSLRPPPRLLKLLEYDTPGAVIVRRLLPAAIALPILVGLAQAMAHRLEWFEFNAGDGVLVIFTIALCAALILWGSRRLDQMDIYRFQAERRAAADRDWLAATLANINEAVVTTTHTGKIDFINRAAEDMFKVKTDEVRGQPLADLIQLVDEDSGEPLACPLGQDSVDDRHKGYSNAPAVRLPNGALLPVALNATSILDNDGRVTGGVLVLRNASAQRAYERALLKNNAELDQRVAERTRELEQALTALRESTTLLQTFAATTPELIYAKNRAGQITLINPAALRAIRMKREQVIGHTELELFGATKQVLEHQQSDQRVIDSGESMVIEETLHFGSKRRTYLVTKSPLRREGGEIFGLVGVAIDITGRKQAERELEQMLVTEYRLREQAENSNRAKDEILAMVSHELRSPMNALKGWSQMFAETTDPDPVLVMRAALAIRRNVEHQGRLINDLLDNSRILLGKLSVEKSPVNLVEVVQAAMDISQESAQSKNIVIRFICANDSMMMMGDNGRLQQIAINLIANGIKFTPSGGCVEVRLLRLSDTLQLSVSDNGIGIAADFLPHVFSPYTQASKSPGKSYRGLGIGLTLVKHLVEIHGGQVQVASPGSGQGATFIVTFQALDDAGLSEARPQLIVNPGADTNANAAPPG